jgi:hypothetical protein
MRQCGSFFGQKCFGLAAVVKGITHNQLKAFRYRYSEDGLEIAIGARG